MRSYEEKFEIYLTFLVLRMFTDKGNLSFVLFQASAHAKHTKTRNIQKYKIFMD